MDAGPARAHWAPAASGSQRRLGGFLATLDIDAAAARQQADAFERLRSGALQAIVVHDVYSAGQMQEAVVRLQRHDPPFLETWFPPAFRARFYGRNINLAAPEMAGYFDEAERFYSQLQRLMAPGTELPARVASLLSALDRGRPHLAAPGAQAGQHYMFTTLREHAEQGYIAAHFDNEMRLRPSYRHLAGLVDEHIVSFVLAFSRADSGGALEVFDLRCEPQRATLLSDDAVRDKPALDELPSVSFRLPPGSLIVLDSGRYLHRVTRVGGTRTRWTACSFMARRRGSEDMLYWG